MLSKPGHRWETYAIFSIYPVGDRGFDPAKVTAILNIQPTRTWRRGDKLKMTDRKRTYDNWEYHSIQPKSREPGKHIKEVLHAVSPRWKELKQRIPSIACKMDLIIYMLDRTTPPVIFSRQSLKRAAELNAKIGLDMYMIPEPAIGENGECKNCGLEHYQNHKSKS
jgi:hypothetical protein